MAFFQAAKCRVGLDAAFIFTLNNAKQIASFGAGTLPLTVEQMLWFEMNGLSVEPVLVDDDLVHKLDLVATNLAVVESHGCRTLFVRRAPIRDDWDSVKDQIMMHILRNKFGQGRWSYTLMNLAGKGVFKFVYHTKLDAYWGDGGPDGHGQNILGEVLSALTVELCDNNAAIQSCAYDNMHKPASDTISYHDPHGVFNIAPWRAARQHKGVRSISSTPMIME